MIVISTIPVYSFIISIQCMHTVTLYYLNNDNVWSFISDTLILIYSYIMGATDIIMVQPDFINHFSSI